MKTPTLKTVFFTGLLLSGNWSFAGSFTSNGTGGGFWNSPSSWIIQNDADGIPDADDDIIIQSPDLIVWQANSFCNDLTVEPGGQIKGIYDKYIQIYGNYQNSGTEKGNGYYAFNGLNKSISGNGIYCPNAKWYFKNHTFIGADVSAMKNGVTRIYNGAIITNSGEIRTNSILNTGTLMGKWINATGSILSLISHSVTVKLDVSSFENTVKTIYGSNNAKLPNCINNTYHHLEIGSSNYSVFLMSDFNINGNLTISSNGNFNMNGYNIHLKGNFANYQNFLQPDNSLLYMDGTSPQLLESYINPTALSNLIIDNPSGVTAGGFEYFTLSNSLIIANGEFNLEKNRITLLSDSTKTAYIGASNGTVVGTMTIQRFVSDRNDGYSDLSSPVTSAIFYDLTDDLDLAFNAYVPNYSVPSCWGYDESLFDYYAIETFDDTLIPGHGYEVYLANDGDSLTPFNATILDMIGTPNVGNIPVPVTVDNDGWNLLGNPYASPIDWTHFRTNCGISMNQQFQFYDETINDFNIGFDGEIIAAGQGFWIEATQAGNATFQENDKVVNTTSAFRSMDAPMFSLRVSSSMNHFTSNAFILLNEGSTNGFDSGIDMRFIRPASKLAPILYSVSADEIKMKLNSINIVGEQTIPFHFKVSVSGSYEISSLHLEALKDAGYDLIILEDKLTNQSHDFSQGSYIFNAKDSDTSDRFVLRLMKSTELISEKTEWVNVYPTIEGIELEFLSDTDEQFSVSIFNLAGQEIVTTQFKPENDDRMEIRLPDVSGGIYIVKIMGGDKIESKKFYHN